MEDNTSAAFMEWVPFLIIGSIVIAVAGMLLSMRRFESRRAEAMRATATQMGARFFLAGDSRIFERIVRFPLSYLGYEGRITNLMRGTRDGVEFAVFDYALRTRRSGKGASSLWTQTVGYFRVPSLNLPAFAVRENVLFDTSLNRTPRWFQRFMNPVELSGFEEVRLDAHPDFTKKFFLLARDPERVKRLFDPAVVAHYEALPELEMDRGSGSGRLPSGARSAGFARLLNTEANGSEFIVYSQGARIAPKQLEWFLDVGIQIARLFRVPLALPISHVERDGDRLIAACPQCAQRYEVTEIAGKADADTAPEIAGQQMTCRECGTLFTVIGYDLRFNCPKCAQRLAVDEAFQGRSLACPSCQARIVVPNPFAAAPVDVSPDVESVSTNAHEERLAGASIARGNGSWRRTLARGRNDGLAQAIFGLVFLAVTLFMGSKFTFAISLQQATRSWPSVEGTLIRSSFGSENVGRTGNRTVNYYPIVEYEYVVNGVRYQGRRVAYIQHGFQSPEAVGAFLASLTDDRTVRVFHSPSDPKVSVLVSGANSVAGSLPIVVLGIFGVIGFCLAFFGFKRWFANKHPV